MEIFNELKKLNNTAIGLGFFDGVHLGHKTLISTLVETAQKNNLKSALITFSSNPAEQFGQNIKYLTTNHEKELLLAPLKIDYLFELEFNKNLSSLSPLEYLNLLKTYLNPQHIITGFNHTFGKNKCGTPELLAEFAPKYGFTYLQIPPIKLNNTIISSTKIRNELNSGNIELATAMLGHPYSISGTVKKGLQLGKSIGYPTANIEFPPQKANIPYGVYSVNINYNNQNFKGLMNYGTKPTINNSQSPVIEVHILNFNENIYNKQITINLIKWIREEQKFNSISELKHQIEKDLKNA